MDIALYVPIAVAVIAAIASFGAARSSGKSAARSQQSAERVNAVNQQVSAIDRATEELRIAFKDVAMAVGAISVGDARASIYGTLEALSACSGATVELRGSAYAMQSVITEWHETKSSDVPLRDRLVDLRTAYRDCQNDLAERRAELVSTHRLLPEPWLLRLLPR